MALPASQTTASLVVDDLGELRGEASRHDLVSAITKVIHVDENISVRTVEDPRGINVVKPLQVETPKARIDCAVGVREHRRKPRAHGSSRPVEVTSLSVRERLVGHRHGRL